MDGRQVPTPNEELLIYQTILGAWPLDPEEMQDFLERVKVFINKAAREAKTHSSWISPNEAHEHALLQFVEAALENSESNPFLEDFLRFQKKVAFYGALNSLSQLVLKIAAPGVPDFYQGSDLWNLSMVDPDNRRPIDFRKRIAMMEELRRREADGLSRLLKELVAHWEDGRVKLYLMYKALDLRRGRHELFLDGDYVPLPAAGSKQEHVCAFARRKEDSWALAVAPRLSAHLVKPETAPLGKKVWLDTRLILPKAAPEKWRNALTGELLNVSKADSGEAALDLHAVLRRFPVALLHNA